MSTRQRKKSYLRPLLVPVIALGFSGYFAWHGWHGSFGIEARRQLAVEAGRLGEELARVKAERRAVERRVALLRASSLESDMLDERAREILGLANSNEIAIVASAPVGRSVNRN
ncbi:MAG: septum formation initiator family protein [Siculibacillus sp.]|nr:septum formation initiator family protein [Siculibacillus sp.]